MYRHGAQFVIKTDHKPLKSLFQAEIKNTKLQRWAIQIAEYGGPIEYFPGKLNMCADMLSHIASVQPVVQYLPPDKVSDVWNTDHIDPAAVSHAQQKEFPRKFLEATQETDETHYWLEQGILYTFAPPYKGADPYLIVILPQEFCLQGIDKCHIETAHAGAQKTLACVQEAYAWPGMRQHIRDYIRSCVHCNTLIPTLCISVGKLRHYQLLSILGVSI